MSRILALLPFVLLYTSSAFSQTQSADSRLMSGAEFRASLSQVEDALPRWEAELKGIYPEKNSEISYSLGKLIVAQRDIGLMDVNNIRQSVARLRIKRTVSEELSLRDFLEGIFDAMNEIETLENAAGVAPYIFEKNAPELGSLYGRIGNDVLARLALLEKGTCPSQN
jgi:hypothetical protein